MKTLTFARRNFKEITRNPITLFFGLTLPLILLFLFQQFNIPSEIYEIENQTPAIIIFSFSFISLFTADLIARDRGTALLTRLYASPMKPKNYILGYTISMLPLGIIQSVILFTGAIFLGIDTNINIIYCILSLIPISILYIALGILLGSICSQSQASGIGSIIVQLVSFTSGIWFSIESVSKVYKYICRILPFSYTLDLTRNITNGNGNIMKLVIIVISYTIIIYIIASIIFKRKMSTDAKN